MTTWPAPASIAWNVARACSRGIEGPCAHCLAHAGTWPALGGELSTMELLHVADELAQWPAPPRLTLSGGDPLGREDLETLVTQATRRGIEVSVATPGGRLSSRRAESLASAGLASLAISLASSDDARHAALAHPGATLDVALAAAARWSATGRPLAVATLVNAGALAGDGADLRALANRARDLGAQRLDVVFPPAGSRRGPLRELTPAESDAAAAVLAEIADIPLSIRSPARCECGLASCRISPDGKLTAGAFTNDVFGDVRRAPILDSWRERHSPKGEQPSPEGEQPSPEGEQPSPEGGQSRQATFEFTAAPVKPSRKSPRS